MNNDHTWTFGELTEATLAFFENACDTHMEVYVAMVEKLAQQRAGRDGKPMPGMVAVMAKPVPQLKVVERDSRGTEELVPTPPKEVYDQLKDAVNAKPGKYCSICGRTLSPESLAFGTCQACRVDVDTTKAREARPGLSGAPAVPQPAAAPTGEKRKPGRPPRAVQTPAVDGAPNVGPPVAQPSVPQAPPPYGNPQLTGPPPVVAAPPQAPQAHMQSQAPSYPQVGAPPPPGGAYQPASTVPMPPAVLPPTFEQVPMGPPAAQPGAPPMPPLQPAQFNPGQGPQPGQYQPQAGGPPPPMPALAPLPGGGYPPGPGALQGQPGTPVQWPQQAGSAGWPGPPGPGGNS